MFRYSIAILIFCLAWYRIMGVPKMFCVYGSWAAHLSGEGRFMVKYIRPELCDYIIYAYAELSPGGGLIVSGDPDHDLHNVNGRYALLRRMKEENPHLKTLIGIGGHRVPGTKFSRVTAVPRIREGLAIGAAEFARFYGFDGVALAWFYPGVNNTHDKTSLSHLVRVMGKRLHNYGLELSVFVSPVREELEKGYNLEEIAKLSDYVFSMTFDYHGPWEPRVRHFSPLYGDSETHSKFVSIESTLNTLITSNVPRKKIVMGIGTFGRSYTLKDSDVVKIGSLSTGPGKPGIFTKEPGFLGYNELCKNLVLSQTYMETTRKTVYGPYTVYGNQWIGFEDERSVRRKVQYATEQQLAGVFLWTMDTDDFRNKCRLGAFPLHVAASQALGKNVSRFIYSYY